jgi:hypothetical protein
VDGFHAFDAERLDDGFGGHAGRNSWCDGGSAWRCEIQIR